MRGGAFLTRHEAVSEGGSATGAGSYADLVEAASSGSEGICLTDSDCCPLVVGGQCDLFCRPSASSEIDARSIQGWRLKGQCARRWEGMCTEDEECSQAFICQRGPSDLAGTCARDAACEKITCQHGLCRDGTCTCDYGFAGARCDRSLEAFAFLYYGNSSANLISTRVLVHSLRAASAQQDVVAIVPKNLANGTDPGHLEILKGDGVVLFFSEPIHMPVSMDKDPIIHERWSGVMNKFAAWGMTAYSRVALVDTDIVFALDGESPQGIFEECRAPLCAVRDMDPRFMNAGVMVLEPSSQRLEHILHALANEHHHFAFPEQSFLTRYCEAKRNRMKLQYLDMKWNSCVSGGMLHNIGWESTGYNALHSCSWQGKPPNMQMCTPPACNQEEELHTVLVWQFFHMQADPCVLRTDEASCGAAGGTACHWCSHYCSDAGIYCDDKLFRQNTLHKQDQPSPMDAERLFSNFSLTTGPTRPKKKSSPPPLHELPQGSQAWPQVAMYQILIDRFAMPNATRCEKLDDYCGGTLRGIRARLPYLEELGVDGVVLSPVVAQMPHGYHGYWAKDLDSVNPEYGTGDDLRELVMLLHEREMKVIADVNLNHAGGPGTVAWDAESVSDLKPFDRPEYYHQDDCRLLYDEDYAKEAQLLERCKLYGLPDYNHENPQVWRRLMEWVREHVDMYGFDGIRVDSARHVSRSFLGHIPLTGSPIPAFHEVISGDMSYVASYATGEYGAVYNYPLYFTLRDIFVPGPGQRPMSALEGYFAKDAPKLDNDVPLYHNALLCVLGMEGLPTLLYGDEQNLPGAPDSSDHAKMDNWRPPLWHAGYDTRRNTFQLIRRVLWLRRRMEGLHQYTQRSIHADHRVMIFSRGPIIFVVTNAGAKATLHSQRMLWHNATAGGHYDKPSWACNLLAADPTTDCLPIVPGRSARLHLGGEPKMYAPSELVAEFVASERETPQKQQEDAQLRRRVAASDPEVVPLSDWHKIPSPPTIKTDAQKRIPRSRRPADGIGDNDPSSHVWRPPSEIPLHPDSWDPPVGTPVAHVSRVSIADACFYQGAGEKTGAIFARRAGATYVLCTGSRASCPHAPDRGVDPRSLKEAAAALAQARWGSVPVVHLTNGVSHSSYHLMVDALPAIAPHIRQLRNGAVSAFFHTGQQVVQPVLNLLGVSQSVFFPPADPPFAEPYHFCTSRMHLEISTRHLQPRVGHLPSYLRAIHGAMPANEGAKQPCGASARGIVLLSRGGGALPLRNKTELATALQSLGRPVRIFTPRPDDFVQMVEALSTAEVIVGEGGADLANAVFAPAGAKVVEIAPRSSSDFQEYAFGDLAGALGLTYIPVGQHVREEKNQTLGEQTTIVGEALASYEADVGKVIALVQRALQ